MKKSNHATNDNNSSVCVCTYHLIDICNPNNFKFIIIFYLTLCPNLKDLLTLHLPLTCLLSISQPYFYLICS